MCVLRNGDLASSSADNTIKIWRIGDNDYQLIHTLKGHTRTVTKVIELEDGRICSCSSLDKTIRIWDNSTYKFITTITTGHTVGIESIIEMNDSTISVGNDKDKTLRIWNKSTYECIKTIQNVQCCSVNSLEKLNNHTVLVGGFYELYVVDTESSEVKQPKDVSLGNVYCFRVIRNDLVLFGDRYGEISEYNPVSNQIISKSKFNDRITCLIEVEHNQLLSCSGNKIIKVFEYNWIIMEKIRMDCFMSLRRWFKLCFLCI